MLESTTYPGTTEELVLPNLQGSGLTVGRGFFLCFSPERVDPGNPDFHTRNIPKVVGGITTACTELGALFYQQALESVIPVQNALNNVSKPARGSKIHIVGVAYKRNIDDDRESPTLDIIMLLQRLGAFVTFSDPFVAVT